MLLFLHTAKTLINIEKVQSRIMAAIFKGNSQTTVKPTHVPDIAKVEC